jgi:signal transduction histidine kinase
MTRRIRVFLLLAFAFSGLTSAASDNSPQQAKAMVEKAAAYLDDNGKEKTLAELDKPDGLFVDGDIYAFAYDLTGTVIAHPYRPELIGRNLLHKPDSAGKLFRKEISELALGSGSGWVDYTYVNPVTHQQQHKTTYVLRAGDIVLCAGVYR